MIGRGYRELIVWQRALEVVGAVWLVGSRNGSATRQPT